MADASNTETPFDLTPTDEQALMRETARRFAEQEMRPVARDADQGDAAPAGFFDKTLELGFQAISIPEAHGGFGADRSPVTNVLIAEDLARGDMALAAGAMSGLSVVNALMDFGSESQQAEFLPQFAEERFVPAALALMEPRPRFEPTELKTIATPQGDSFVLDGVKHMVPLATQAEVLLVVAEVPGEGPAAFLVPGDAKGVQREAQRTMGLRALQLGKVGLEKVQVPASARLGDKGQAFDLERLVDLSRIGLSALAVGTGQAMLEYVKDYCNERTAFGEPITNRQSVAFMIADIAIELEGMRMLTYRAASRAEQGLPFHREAYLAYMQAAERGMEIGTNGVQLLGGHGFTREHPVEQWYRHLRAIGVLEGTLCV